MISVKIHNANGVLGKPDNWDSRNGPVDNLFIRREKMDGLDVMLSTWKPTGLELEMLIKGGSVVLGVLGTGHPPVMMYVSEDD